MNKKAEVISGIIIAVGMVVAMVYGATQVSESIRYIGDLNTTKFYDKTKCNTDLIIEEKNRVKFSSKEEALANEFEEVKGCV